MESSALVLRTRYRTAVRAVRVGERLRSVASGENGAHGVHAARRAEKVSTTVWRWRGALSQEDKCSKMAKRQRHHS